ncbi:MAG: FecCD family ABC transporter permease [Planctomycetota bacterium]|jgi:iron complex transport system permease protein
MGRVSRQSVGLAALGLVAIAMCAMRILIDRDLEGAVTLAVPAPEYAWIRWTAVAVGATVGSALATSGVLLQALLRNPLASPFILGISAGAGLGVMVAIYLSYEPDAPAHPSASAHGLAALIGALAVLGIVYTLSQRRGWLDPVSLILIGVIVSAICGALIMFLHHLVPTGLHWELTRWMMGRIPESAPTATLAVAGGLAVVGAAVAMLMGRAMDAATLGDDEARSVGLALGPLRLWMFVLAGALTAGAVALCGPIGFVGLVAPHAGRLILGPRHTPLVLGAALVGILLVVGADVGRQAIQLGAGRMPIGVFTALLGGPAFIWLLRTGRGQA